MLQNNSNNLRSAKRSKPSKQSRKQIKVADAKKYPNNISQLLTDRGFKTVTPTETVLQTLDITIHRFNKILDNKVVMTIDEAAGFSNWLGVPIEDLTAAPTVYTQNVAGKFGLDT